MRWAEGAARVPAIARGVLRVGGSVTMHNDNGSRFVTARRRVCPRPTLTPPNSGVSPVT